ncbi:MarR family transcriptional regulator [Paenibacillus validus]|uniref:MarR family winged helix-turn-helix transcriptional regulator n=1 Tax=Paenibacillus TaxID=44249 RepID=UPI000FDC51EA|nr:MULTISPECIES: MarR family transcriptional regulator [Paenibacillus]MED4604216.1 MarR family transcriptional regulator [Paenibacillus validus]MED4609588.1 MarR family transcriptional regulator [Paenibacillus validus]
MPSQSINRLWRSLLDLDRGLKQTLCLLSQEAEVPASAVALVFKLEHEDSLKVNDVATVLGITIGAASNLIDKLEEKQWVERVRSEEDRRIMYVRLTGLGMEQLLRWREHFAEHADLIFAKVPESEIAQFDDKIQRLSQYLSAYNVELEKKR